MVLPSKAEKASLAKTVEEIDFVAPSLIEIKSKLPAHCFQSNVKLSLYYFARDFFMSISLILLARYLYLASQDSFVGTLCIWAAYPLYAFLLGTIMWGIFVLGHDCGHGSFSLSPLINFVAGTLLHSFILVPYVPWKLTHHHHHKNTGHIDNDEIFMPLRLGKTNNLVYRVFTKLTGKLPLILFPWFVYLLAGFPTKNAILYHLNPWASAKFKGHRVRICTSHLGLAGMTYFLYQWCQADGVVSVFFLYFVPLVIFSLWLVVTTFLHHNEAGQVKWFSAERWNYVKGNLSSIDRSFGTILDNLTHHIGTHQIHHLFPIIPHYHLEEATAAFRKAFPHLVFKSERSIVPAFMTVSYTHLTLPTN